MTTQPNPIAAVPQLYAALRSPRFDALMDIARDFSPRIERYGQACVVLDISGLGGLLGGPSEIGAELVRAALQRCGPVVSVVSPALRSPRLPRRSISRYGIRIEPSPLDHDQDEDDDGDVPIVPVAAAQGAAVQIAVAPTQVSAMLLSIAHRDLTIVESGAAASLADVSIRTLQQLLAGIHDVTVFRPVRVKTRSRKPLSSARAAWPAWAACEDVFDVLHRWGIHTLGAFAALPAGDVSARLGQAGVALQRLACGMDPAPLVPDPGVRRFCASMELEWPIDGLEPLSFVLARLLDPLSAALEQADRAAASIRLELRLVDRTTHVRVRQLPSAMRDPRVLRTLLLLDLESHPPAAAIDVVGLEIDPAPGRVLQYSLLERARPSAETIATLTARLGALVGESRCGMPALVDTYRPDGFEMRRFAPDDRLAVSAAAAVPGVGGCFRRFRPPVAVRVSVERGRPVRVAIDRRGMPGGQVAQAAGPWRTSGEWWAGPSAHWDRDEWDVALSDGSLCRLFQDREGGRWFMEGVID